MANQSSAASQSDSGSQSISISVGSNSGQIQAVNAGGDAVVSGAMGDAEAQAEISQDEAVELLAQVVALIEAADLATEMTLLKHPFRSGVKAQPGVEF